MDTNYWSTVYKHNIGKDYKFKAGYDSEVRLGWASLWVSSFGNPFTNGNKLRFNCYAALICLSSYPVSKKKSVPKFVLVVFKFIDSALKKYIDSFDMFLSLLQLSFFFNN